jgi:hypothetical protein
MNCYFSFSPNTLHSMAFDTDFFNFSNTSPLCQPTLAKNYFITTIKQTVITSFWQQRITGDISKHPNSCCLTSYHMILKNKSHVFVHHTKPTIDSNKPTVQWWLPHPANAWLSIQQTHRGSEECEVNDDICVTLKQGKQDQITKPQKLRMATHQPMLVS